MSPGTTQQPVGLRAAYQAIKRAEASDRGDCLVCCKRPQSKGTRCLECAALRANEAARSTRAINRVRKRRMVRPKSRQRINAANYRRLRAAGICTRCAGPTSRWSQCLGCRKEMHEVRKARRLPQAASGSQGRGERTREREVPQIEEGAA